MTEKRENLFDREEPSIFRRIYWKLDRLRTTIRNIPNNIKMICQWIPVLWNNWDWDYNFLLDIMKFKLQRMSNHMIKHNIILDAEKISNQMNECISCIERIQKGEYTVVEDEEHEKKWGKILYELIPCDHKDCKQLDIYSALAREQRKEEEERQESADIRALAEKRLEADYDLLFDTIRKNFRSWWD